LVVAVLFTFSSCGINSAFVVNSNQNSTQVHLKEKNFNVVQRISGSSEVKYVCLIGGMSQKKLYENAYAEMMKEADINSGSKALVNIFTEEQFRGFFPFYYFRTVTYSGNIIEFTK
jgi:hypothetical protein